MRVLTNSETKTILGKLAQGKALQNPKFSVSEITPQSFKLQFPKSALVITDLTNINQDRGGGELAVYPMIRIEALNERGEPIALRDIRQADEQFFELPGAVAEVLKFAAQRLEKDKALAKETIDDLFMNL